MGRSLGTETSAPAWPEPRLSRCRSFSLALLEERPMSDTLPEPSFDPPPEAMVHRLDRGVDR